MRLPFELARRSFDRALAYRAAAFAGLVTNVFFGLIRAAILLALYGEQQVVEGFTTAGAVTYTGLTQAVIAFLSLFGWYELMITVHRGEVAADLLKPLDFYSFWLARDLGRALAGLLLRGVPIMLVYALVFDIVVPHGALQWLALAMSLTLAWLVSFGFRFLVNLSAFWSPNALGIGRFFFMTALFFSGFMMPLSFFPDWVGRLASLTPFPAMLDTVVEVYLGVVRGPELIAALAVQAGWALALALLGRLLLGRAVRRLVVLGG